MSDISKMSKEDLVQENLKIIERLSVREKQLLEMAQSLSETNEQL